MVFLWVLPVSNRVGTGTPSCSSCPCASTNTTWQPTVVKMGEGREEPLISKVGNEGSPALFTVDWGNKLAKTLQSSAHTHAPHVCPPSQFGSTGKYDSVVGTTPTYLEVQIPSLLLVIAASSLVMRMRKAHYFEIRSIPCIDTHSKKQAITALHTNSYPFQSFFCLSCRLLPICFDETRSTVGQQKLTSRGSHKEKVDPPSFVPAQKPRRRKILHQPLKLSKHATHGLCRKVLFPLPVTMVERFS